MYSQHFGLSQDPFSIAPDPRYLFMSERHREALAHLLYGVAGSSKAAGGTGGGFVLLTGDIGTGKTTICRCFLEQIPLDCHVAYIFNPKLSVIELLQSICEEFHVNLGHATREPTAKDYTDALNNFLLQSHASGQSSVLIIDEAQNLAADVLEQLRLLTNLETNERKLLQIVLIGQPELRDMLARPELEQLAQRVIARFHLDALSASESTQYIGHRLAVAGHTGALPFDRRALQRIHQLTRGVPRRINLLCGRALLGAWATGQQLVSRAVVNKAAAEVFGAAPSAPSNWGKKPMLYALAGLCLIALLMLVSARFKAAPPVAGAVAPTSAASSKAASAQPVAPTKIDSLETLLPQLPGDINSAWRELAPARKLPPSSNDPCQDASELHIQCYHATRLSVPLLRQLGRPGILTLQVDQQAPVYAVLTGLSDQTATLQIAGQSHQVRLITLAKLWRGDFATFWKPPASYLPDLPDGSSGATIDWLALQLGRLDGIAANPGSNTLDAALRARVQGFQAARGINADGRPGPMTFMQLESALDIQSPHLINVPVAKP